MIFSKEFRARALAFLTLGLIFGAGFGIGLAVERNLIAGTSSEDEITERTEASRENRSDERDRDDDGDDRSLIVHHVGLTPEQRVLVDETVEEFWARMREIGRKKREIDRQFNERTRQVVEEGRAAIMEHLTEEQKLRYQELLAEFDDRRGDGRRERRDSVRDDDRDR